MSWFKTKSEELQRLEDEFISGIVKMHLNAYKNSSESKIKEYNCRVTSKLTKNN